MKEQKIYIVEDCFESHLFWAKWKNRERENIRRHIRRRQGNTHVSLCDILNDIVGDGVDGDDDSDVISHGWIGNDCVQWCGWI